MSAASSRSTATISAVGLSLALVSTALAGGMIDLGSLGGDSTIAYALNDSGQVVGQSDVSPDVPHAFLWENGVMTDLGTLGGPTSVAFAINSSGQVAGEADVAANLRHAFIWESGVMTDLGTLGGSRSEARAINESGQVTGRAQVGGDAFYQAFLWEAGVMTPLGTGWSHGLAINSSGQVVGQMAAPGGDRGFLWDGATMIALGDLGGSSGAAQAINDSGQAVGVSYLPGNLAYHAVLWENGMTIDLGTLGGTLSWAIAINESGLIAGFATTPGDAELRPVVWENGVIRDLGASGSARAINDAGQVVGYATFPGSGRNAFLWEDGVLSDLGNDCGLGSDAAAINAGGQVAGATLTSDGFLTYRAFLYTPEPRSCLAGNVDTGDGSPPADVLSIDGSAGNAFREVSVLADTAVSLTIASAPSFGPERAHYGVWIFDGPMPFEPTDVMFRTQMGFLFNLGAACVALPANNIDQPGSVPCPMTFPRGFASKAFSNAKADALCLNRSPAYPRSPTTIEVVFPRGEFIVGGLVQDRNSPNSPLKHIAITNWIRVCAR